MTMDIASCRHRAVFTRRSLLKGAAAVALPTIVRAPVGAASRRVIVVGAGISGIAAARDLEGYGFDVTVLEARSRIGGRIQTDRSWGVPLDLGASWIHGASDANPIWQLRNQYSYQTSITDWEDITIYDVDGDLVTDNQYSASAARYRSIYRKARRWADRQDEDVSLQDGFDAVLRTRNLPSEEQRALEFNINYEIEQDYGGSIDELSAWWFDQDSWLGGRDDAYMQDGYGRLVTTLADDLDVQLNTKVTSVAADSSGVTVRTDNDTFDAAYAVITLPLGVLKAGDVSFSPRLPRQKSAAIDLLGVGTLNKLYLLFRERFWDDTTGFAYRSDTRGEWALWLDLEQLVDAPILAAYNAADFGAALERRSDQQTLDGAMAVLRTIYGRSVPAPQSAIITRWNADPYALGSYSHIPVGASGKHYRALSLPSAERLFWAGEATNRRYPQTVAGAYLSGQRAARQIMERE